MLLSRIRTPISLERSLRVPNVRFVSKYTRTKPHSRPSAVYEEAAKASASRKAMEQVKQSIRLKEYEEASSPAGWMVNRVMNKLPPAAGAGLLETAGGLNKSLIKNPFIAGNIPNDSNKVTSNDQPTNEKNKRRSFVKLSTAPIKYSASKLNFIGRFIAKRSSQDAINQLEYLNKGPARRIRSTLVVAQNQALDSGFDLSKLVVAQAWVTRVTRTIARDRFKRGGRAGIRTTTWNKLHFILAEGLTKEQHQHMHARYKFQKRVRNQWESWSAGVGKMPRLPRDGLHDFKW